MPSQRSFHMLVLSTLVCVTLSQTSLYTNAFADEVPRAAAAGGANTPARAAGRRAAAPQPPDPVPQAAPRPPAAASKIADPAVSAIKNALTAAAVAHGIPPEILYAVAYQESNWRQFEDDGKPLVTDDGGIGIMQVTSYGGYDVSRLQNDTVYNINAGADILSSKFDESPRIGDGRRDCYENWYYAVWAYNGWTPGSGYADSVWSLVASGPNGWWTGVPVTPVPGDQQEGGLGVSVSTPQPDHVWSQAAPTPVAPVAPASPAPAAGAGQSDNPADERSAASSRQTRARAGNEEQLAGNEYSVRPQPDGQQELVSDGEQLAGNAFEDEYRKLVSRLTRVNEQNPEFAD